MTGIAGWLGPSVGDSPPENILTTMLDAGHRHPGAVRKEETSGGAGLGGQGWPSELSTVHRDGIFAAVYGKPNWVDADLRGTAASDGSASALIDAWKRQGTHLFPNICGPASFAIVDTGKKEAIIAVDRIGVRQMAFAATPDGGFVFSSDARSVCAHPAVATRISAQGLFNYLFFYISPAPSTVFDGVEKLRPGEYAHFKNNSVTKGFYWQPDYGESLTGNVDDLRREVWEKLYNSVGASLSGGSGTTPGAFLSGGLDSTTVSGMLAGHVPGAKCFTIAFPEEKYNELPWAEDGARTFGIDHVVHTLTPDETSAAIPGIVDSHDEPYGNSSSVPAFICASVAREHGIDILLAGDGGDEIFAGNERYVEQRRYDSWYRLPSVFRNGFLLPILRSVSSGRGGGIVARARSYADRAATPLPDRLQAYNPLASGAVAAVFDGDFLSGIDRDEPFDLLREIYNRPQPATELKRMHFLDLQITLADNDLRKVNRACELAGVQVAYPMLDEVLYAAAAKIPSDVLLPDGRLRGFYKDAMADFLPRSILVKPKHGFGMPFEEWTRTPGTLKEMAEASLTQFGERQILSPQVLSDLVEGVRRGTGSAFGGMVWDIMMLETWLQRHQSIASFR